MAKPEDEISSVYDDGFIYNAYVSNFDESTNKHQGT